VYRKHLEWGAFFCMMRAAQFVDLEERSMEAYKKRIHKMKMHMRHKSPAEMAKEMSGDLFEEPEGIEADLRTQVIQAHFKTQHRQHHMAVTAWKIKHDEYLERRRYLVTVMQGVNSIMGHGTHLRLTESFLPTCREENAEEDEQEEEQEEECPDEEGSSQAPPSCSSQVPGSQSSPVWSSQSRHSQGSDTRSQMASRPSGTSRPSTYGSRGSRGSSRGKNDSKAAKNALAMLEEPQRPELSPMLTAYELSAIIKEAKQIREEQRKAEYMRIQAEKKKKEEEDAANKKSKKKRGFKHG